MRISFRLQQILEPHMRRGRINEIARYTGIERHTVKAMATNSSKYLSIEALSQLCNYLVHELKFDPSLLPGALFGRDPEVFWQLLDNCEHFEFVLGKRTAAEWAWSDYVMASDARLQAMLTSDLSRFDASAKTMTKAESEKAHSSRHLLPQYTMVTAPPSNIRPDDSSADWQKICEAAAATYHRPLRSDISTARVLIGSIKVNPVLEMMFSSIFGAQPFRNQDDVAQPRDRTCPIMFRYRDDRDPRPPSCIGGMRLARDTEAPQPGIYFEGENGVWQCCPWVYEKRESALLFYAYQPGLARLDVALGGFSSRATDELSHNLKDIGSQLGDPTYKTGALELGMYVIEFTLDHRGKEPPSGEEDRTSRANWKIFPIPQEALARRLEKQAQDHTADDE